MLPLRNVSLVAAWLLLSFGNVACSRNETAPERARPPPLPSAAFGPLAELVTSASPPPAPAVSGELALPVVDGPALLQMIRASGHKGVVVNAWASWCDPCQHELPMLNRVSQRLAKRGVPIWLVSVDAPESLPSAKAVLAALHVELTSMAAAPPLQAFKAAMNPKWPGMIPVSFLFDATGKLRYFWAGEVYEKELVPVVEGFLAGKKIDGASHFGLAPGATQSVPD